jgi:hypothetical protein
VDVTRDKWVEEDPTELVIGYEAQINPIFVDHAGPWTGVTNWCA